MVHGQVVQLDARVDLGAVLVRQVRAHRFALSPYTGELNVVTLAEFEFAHGLAGLTVHAVAATGQGLVIVIAGLDAGPHSGVGIDAQAPAADEVSVAGQRKVNGRVNTKVSASTPPPGKAKRPPSAIGSTKMLMISR